MFLDIDPETQKARLLQRGGPDKTRQFEEIWIPREEAYLQTCGIRELCDMILEA